MSNVIRNFFKIKGFENRFHDIIFSTNLDSSKTGNVIYFGGDIQDFEADMNFSEFKMWSLEATALILLKKFPSSFIWIVRPSCFHNNTFSDYNNFVKSSAPYGNPSHSIGQNSWLHLYKLLKNSFQQVLDYYKNHNIHDLNRLEERLPTILIGFSKGCVVLNQLVYDMPANNYDEKYYQNNSILNDINCDMPYESIKKGPKSLESTSCSRVENHDNDEIFLNNLLKKSEDKSLNASSKSMNRINEYIIIEEAGLFVSVFIIETIFWLDAGHNGGKNIWITDDILLKKLALKNIKIEAYVTPRQVECQLRPWIGEEFTLFVNKLKKLNAKINFNIYRDEKIEHTLDFHFKLLTLF